MLYAPALFFSINGPNNFRLRVQIVPLLITGFSSFPCFSYKKALRNARRNAKSRSPIFWDITLCSPLKIYRIFREDMLL
jgi:hypothetical protein